MSTELITASRLAAYRRCARLHKLKYDDLIEPVHEEAGARSWGSGMHGGLEAWFRAWHQDGRDPHAEAVEILNGSSELDAFERARAIAAMAGYGARWGAESLTVLAVEIQFEAPLINPDSLAHSRLFQVAGKIDAIVADERGDRWVVEHKTSSEDIEPGSAYWQRLRLDAQVSIYLDGARALGFEPKGCIYDVIKRPAQRPALATPLEKRRITKAGVLDARQRETDETPEDFGARVMEAIAAAPSDYYQRGIVVRTGDEMTDARREIWQSAKLLRFAQREGLQVRNPDACNRFGSVCAFFDLCSGAASVDGVRFRTRERAHPELAAPTVPKEGATAA